MKLPVTDFAATVNAAAALVAVWVPPQVFMNTARYLLPLWETAGFVRSCRARLCRQVREVHAIGTHLPLDCGRRISAGGSGECRVTSVGDRLIDGCVVTDVGVQAGVTVTTGLEAIPQRAAGALLVRVVNVYGPAALGAVMPL